MTVLCVKLKALLFIHRLPDILYVCMYVCMYPVNITVFLFCVEGTSVNSTAHISNGKGKEQQVSIDMIN